jgi:DNA-binding response OmpR family regulator
MDDRPPTILCVDDDPEILDILKEFFAREGFHVVTAANGVEAMFQVQRCLPKAIIIDLFMPRLGGLGALDRIRRLDPGIVIVLMSGVPAALEMINEARVEVAGVLAKPLNLDELLGTLARAGVTPIRADAGTTLHRPPQEAPRPARKRVLIVDDDPDIRAVFVEYLERKGFEVRQAGDGEEALRRIPEFRPHLILLDIAMPRLSGVETLRRIKASNDKTCVIMISGIEDVEIARQTLAIGASDYVPKPVDFPYLDSVLEVHLFMDQI